MSAFWQVKPLGQHPMAVSSAVRGNWKEKGDTSARLWRLEGPPPANDEEHAV